MSNTVSIRNRHLVEVTDSSDYIIAKAVRADDNSAWFLGAMIDGLLTPVGEIYTTGPEVLQRKLILAAMAVFK